MKLLSQFADRIGVFASTACAIHCLVLPLLLVSGVALPATLLEDEYFHRFMLLVVLPAALIAFGLGCRRHKDSWVLGVGLLGVAGITAAAFMHEILGENGERTLTVISALLLIYAHVRNFRLCRATSCAN